MANLPPVHGVTEGGVVERASQPVVQESENMNVLTLGSPLPALCP